MIVGVTAAPTDRVLIGIAEGYRKMERMRGFNRRSRKLG
jgi:hypothetical protein